MSKKDKQTSNELNQFVPAGLKWLYEMEAVNSPVLLNNLYGNIFSFPNVNDAEILIDKNNRKMLILIHFNWLSRKIFKNRKKQAIISILDQLQELLPSFTFRVIEDKDLFDLAVKRMTEHLNGGQNVKTNQSNNDDPNSNNSSPSDTSGNIGEVSKEDRTETKSEIIEASPKKPTED